MEIFNLKKKKIKLLTKEKQELYENAKICYKCIEKFKNKHVKYKEYCKVTDHCYHAGEYRDAVHSI